MNYRLYREDFLDRPFYDLVSYQEGLPEYCDIFDHDSEIAKDYQDIFNVDVYILEHENIRIQDEETIELLLNIFEFENNVDWFNLLSDILDCIKTKQNCTIELKGDGGELGFILDFFNKDTEEFEDSFTFWFEDYQI